MLCSTWEIQMRSFGLLFCAVVAMMAMVGAAEKPGGPATNLAMYAKASTSFVSGYESLEAINDGVEPRNSRDHDHGAYGNWPRTGTQWVQYEWPRRSAP